MKLFSNDFKKSSDEFYSKTDDFNEATNKNNKAVFSVKIKSIEMNYKKYKELLLSEIFFYEEKFPIALIDTRQFSYKNQDSLELMVELNIKGIVHDVPIELQVIRLAEKLVQIKSKLTFSRTAFKIGVGINKGKAESLSSKLP